VDKIMQGMNGQRGGGKPEAKSTIEEEHKKLS
jgi:hypothetical protein